MSRPRSGSEGYSVAEIASLFQRLAQDLGQIKDTDLALDVILRQGKKLLGASSAMAIVFGEYGRSVHNVLVDLPPESGALFAEAFETLFFDAPQELLSGALIIDDLSVEDTPIAASLSKLEMESCVVLPLALRGDLLGGLCFLFEQPHQINDLRLSWAVVLAGHAALAVENVQLVDVALRQATELGAFYETAAAVEDKKDLNLLLDQIINQTTSLLGCQMGIIYLADEDRKMLTSVVHQGIPNEIQVLTCSFGEGVAGEVAESRVPIAMDECQNWEGAVAVSDGSNHTVRVLGVPMIWRQRLIGVLDVAANSSRRPFSETDIRLAKSVAYQAANALGIANLIESERKQYHMAEALQEASLVINHQVELDEILDRILEQVMHAFPCDAANFQHIEGNRIRLIRNRGYDQFKTSFETMNDLDQVLEDNVILQRMMTGEVIVVPDTTQEPIWSTQPGREWVKSWAGAPIQYSQDILGFINLDSANPGTFDDATSKLLAAFAAHASAAMHKAELYRRLAEEHRRLRTLYKIERAVTASLEPDEILTRLLEGALDAIRGVYAQVFLVDEDEEHSIVEGTKVSRLSTDEDLAHNPLAKQLAEESIHQIAPLHSTLNYSLGSYSVIAFPIATGQHVWGTALVWGTNDNENKDAWLEVFRAAGQQAGLALTNADQHVQVQRRLTEMRILQRVVGTIAGRLEVDAMLQEVAEQLHTKLGFPAVQIYQRVDDDLVLEVACGPHPIVEKLSVERGITGRVARTGVPALIEDVRQDPDYVAGLIGTKAELTVPIRLGDEIIGVINIETSDPAQIDSGALEILMLLADQVSVALQNAMLYEQVQDNVVELEEQIRKRTKELEQAFERAKSADLAKAQFVEDVSHELRTPLTNIGLYLDLVEMGDDERREEYMVTLRREMERLGTLIEQLLNISHLDTGQVELEAVPTKINSLVQMLIVDRARMIGKKGINLNVITGDNLPLVNIDPQLIIQAMTNLLTNAMNYTSSGGKITIETQLAKWKGKPWITIAVSDTGPGVTETEKKRIFDRFYRGLVGRASGIPGTGLGLSISQEIVERHDGRIVIISKSGEGTTFTIWLPADDEKIIEG